MVLGTDGRQVAQAGLLQQKRVLDPDADVGVPATAGRTCSMKAMFSGVRGSVSSALGRM